MVQKVDNTILLVQSFGHEKEYRRAIFLIWSFAAFSQAKTKVALFTDKPEFFDPYLNSLDVDFHLLTDELIREMKGDINFVHRMKICIIGKAFDSYRCNVFYVDSDACFIADPSSKMKGIDEEHVFMHLEEYRFSSLQYLPMPSGKPFLDFIGHIRSNDVRLSDGTSFRVSLDSCSWNAGVIMLHRTHQYILRDIFELTDQFFRASACHASEQYAFSIMLSKNFSLASVDDVIFHYWHRVQKQIVDLKLKETLNTDFVTLDADEKRACIKEQASNLAWELQHHYLTYEDNAVQAFNENRYAAGIKHMLRSLWRQPSNLRLIKDFLYHTKRILIHQ